jgi:hypothetical protein
MRILSRHWVDLEEGFEKAEELEWQAWLEGGSSIAARLCETNDLLQDAQIEYRRDARAADRQREAALGAIRWLVAGWTSAVVPLLGGLWLLRVAPVDNPLARALAGASEAILARGDVLPVMAALSVVGFLGVGAVFMTKYAVAVAQARQSERKLEATAQASEAVILNAPTVSVMGAWASILTVDDATEGDVLWRRPKAVEELMLKFREYLSDGYYGLVNVPITGTSTVDLLIVGRSRVWALELGGRAPAAGGGAGEPPPSKTDVRPTAERQRRVDQSVAALKELLRGKCEGYDVENGASGLVVNLDSSWMSPWDVPAKHTPDQCWVCCYREVYDDGCPDEQLQWRLLGAIARNAAELMEEQGETAVSVAESAYEQVMCGIRCALGQDAGMQPVA